MTLFIRTSDTRVFEIDDLYVMVVFFLLSYSLTKITKSAIIKLIEKQQLKKKGRNSRLTRVGNVKGGALLDLLDVRTLDEQTLGLIILSCIADHESYIVKDKRIIKIIFVVLKEQLTDKTLVLSPNMIRFLALQLISKNKPSRLVEIVGTLRTVSENPVRLIMRSLGAIVLGTVAAVGNMLPYGIILMLMYFDATKNCGHICSNYFEQLPKDQITKIFEGKERVGPQLVIAGNDEARQVEIYEPTPTPDKETVSPSNERQITKSYRKSRKQAKVVKFSDFKKKDKVLSSFDNLEEPYVEQQACELNNIEKIIEDATD